VETPPAGNRERNHTRYQIPPLARLAASDRSRPSVPAALPA